MVYVLLAKGFEEMEALAPVDVLRRGGVEVKTVGVTGKRVSGAHGISVNCDVTIDEVQTENLEAVVLPGGMPGTVNLEQNVGVQALVDFAANNKKIIGAICAAPSILGKKGLLQGKNAVCYTGFEKDLQGAHVLTLPAVRDGNIITAWGAGAAIDFGLLLLSAVTENEEIAKKTGRQMRYPTL